MGKGNESAYEAYQRIVDRSVEKAGGVGPFGTREVEEWRPIPRILKLEISNMGRVRDPTGRIRSQHTDHAGYKKISSYGRCYSVHRLVLEAFVGPCPPKHEGAHYDGKPANNRLTNLRWATSKENTSDTIRLGRFPIGSKQGRAKLDDGLVVELRRRYRAGGHTIQSLADEIGVSQTIVMFAIQGRTWRHVAEPTVEVGAQKLAHVTRGERHHLAKLTAGDVAEMRGLFASGDHTKRALAVRFGIHYNTCRMALDGRTWKHI